MDVNGNITYTGYMRDLMEELRKVWYFDYSFQVSPNNTYGYQSPDGGWVGTIGEVLEGRADISGCPLTITAKRGKVVKFSVPFQTSGVAIVLRHPKLEPNSATMSDRSIGLFTPFTYTVWLTVLGSLLVYGFVLYIISYFNPYEWRRMMQEKEATIREGESFTCLNSFWFLISAFTLQGYTRSPRSLGGRIVVMVWWWFTILLLSCYIANLSNFLKIPQDTSRLQQYANIRSLEDLANSDVPVAIMKNGYLKRLMDQSNVPYIRKINLRFEKKGSEYVESTKEGLDFVREGEEQKAYITDTHSVSHRITDTTCELYIAQEYILTLHHGLAFRPGSPLTATFNQAILKLLDTGKLAELEDTWFKQHCMAPASGDLQSSRMKIPEFYPVDLPQIYGILIALAGGLVVGSGVTVMEILVYHSTEKNTKRNSVTEAKNEDGPPDVYQPMKDSTTV